MTYKKFLHNLEWNYSKEKLTNFLQQKRILWRRYGVKTKEQQKYIKDIYIKKLIKQADQENKALAQTLKNAPIIRLAFVRCKQNHISITPNNALYYLLCESQNIVNQLAKDTEQTHIKQLFKNYIYHVKKGHYEYDTAI